MCILLPWSHLAVAKGDVSLDEGAETLTLTFSDSLPVGNASLCIRYRGILNDKMKGFYRSKYTAPSGEERYCAVTQFEVCVRICVYVCMCLCICVCSIHVCALYLCIDLCLYMTLCIYECMY